MHRIFLGSMIGACWLACANASAQIPSIHLGGTVENYMVAGSRGNGVRHRQTWEQLTADIGPSIRIVASNEQEIDENFLDEAYVSYETDRAVVRFGRFRTPFGFSSWNELNYIGLIDLPMIRTEDEAPDLGLYDQHAGLEATFGSPSLQVQASLVDVSLASRQIMPDRMNHGFVRLQTTCGSFIVGVSALKQISGSDPNDERFYGADFRWTAPQWQLRGEYVKADSSGGNASRGGYLDAFYRLPRSTKTRILARVEEYRGFEADQTGRHWAVGIRQVFDANFTLSFNYGSGNHVEPAASLTGWTVQLMTSLHF